MTHAIIHIMGLSFLILTILPILYILLLKLIRINLKPIKSNKLRDRRPFYPSISIIVPAHNEEENIERKIKQLLSIDYGKDRYEIIIIDDGSTDQTHNIIEEYSKKYPNRIVCKRLDYSRGKIFALNKGIEMAKSDIIVFTDADTDIEHGSIKSLIRNFRHNDVGAVSGTLRIKDNGASSSYEKSYVQAEHYLRGIESDVTSVPFLFGQLSAFRKDVLSEVKSYAAVDDIEIALSIREKGYRVISDQDAVVHEKAPKTLKELFSQKKRRTTCTIEVALRHLSLLHPKHGLFALTFFVRRILPLFLPFILMVDIAYISILIGFWITLLLIGVIWIGLLIAKRDFTAYMTIMQAIVGLAWVEYMTKKTPKGADWKHS